MSLFTIGHSTHSGQEFVSLLQRHRIETVADVRSHPWSRFNPQFRKPELARHLESSGLAYQFLGRELGARSDNPRCYVDGRVSYERLAAEPAFREGIERLLRSVKEHRIVLMCAERDPLQCHRMILVCRQMRAMVDEIGHILADGTLETHEQAEARLMQIHNPAPDLLSDEGACIERAYAMQARKIARVDRKRAGTRRRR